MATHSSVLAWRLPGTGEPGGLLSMGSHRVRHDWSDLAVVAAAASLRGACWAVLCVPRIVQAGEGASSCCSGWVGSALHVTYPPGGMLADG